MDELNNLRILQAGSDPEITTALKEESGLATVRIVRERRRIQTNRPRDIRKVEPGLLRVFDQLAFGELPWPLFLCGPTGAGKTSAALCFIDRVASARFTTCDELATTIMLDPEAAEREFGRIEESDMVVVDEIAAKDKVGDLHYGLVKRVLDIRENDCHRKGIYISNVMPERISAIYDDRVASRMTCGTIAFLDSKDGRKVRVQR